MICRKPYQLSNRRKRLQLLFVLCAAALLLPMHIAAAQKANNWLEHPVTISFHEESLGKVLDKITRQADLAVVYDQKLAAERVTGNYHGVKISEVVTRLFKDKNVIIQVNDDKKIIIVKTFGAKDFIRAEGQNSSTPITLAELNAINALQYQECQESIAEEDDILGSGMTLDELNAMHELQYDVIKRDITGDKMNSENRLQYAAYQANLINESEELEGGLNRRQLNALHAEQFHELMQQMDSYAIIPEFDISKSQLDSMHEQQFAGIKDNAEDTALYLDF